MSKCQKIFFFQKIFFKESNMLYYKEILDDICPATHFLYFF